MVRRNPSNIAPLGFIRCLYGSFTNPHWYSVAALRTTRVHYSGITMVITNAFDAFSVRYTRLSCHGFYDCRT